MKYKFLSFLFSTILILSLLSPVNVLAASINKSSTSLDIGSNTTLKVGTNKNITWTSSDKKIATVNSKGKVIAKKEGKATLTFEVYDSKTNELVKTIIYEINITSDLKVSYEEIK